MFYFVFDSRQLLYFVCLLCHISGVKCMQLEWFVGVPIRLGGRDFLLDVTRYWMYGKLLVFLRSSLGGRDLFDRSTRFQEVVFVLIIFYVTKYKGAIFFLQEKWSYSAINIIQTKLFERCSSTRYLNSAITSANFWILWILS